MKGKTGSSKNQLTGGGITVVSTGTDLPWGMGQITLKKAPAKKEQQEEEFFYYYYYYLFFLLSNVRFFALFFPMSSNML